MAEDRHILRLLRRPGAAGAVTLSKRRMWYDDSDANDPPAEDPEPEPSESWLDNLPEQARNYIKELRSENAQRRLEAKEVRQKLDELDRQRQQAEEADLAKKQEWQQLAERHKAEAEKFKAELEQQQVKSLRTQVAVEVGLPLELAERLTGSTEEEIREDAQGLAALIQPQPQEQDPPKGKQPARSQTTSAVPDGQPTKETDAQKRERMNPRFNPPSIFESADIIVHDD